MILSVLAAISILLYLFSPNDNTEEENLVTKEVEFIVKNAELLGSSKNGDFSYKIFSKKAKANDLNNQIFLEQVKLTYTDEDVNWIITSDRGQIISDMNILTLSGNVLIKNNTENNNSKKVKFKRLANKRVNKSLISLKLVSNLANKKNYSFSEREVKQIMNKLNV